MKPPATPITQPPIIKSGADHFRFHRIHEHLASTFGNERFALQAEAFARFFGTPVFLGAQTALVALWIFSNSLGFTKFDLYPFILLNLAFSLQAAYAAPLILLAQTRQAARDKVHVEADAKHREAIATTASQNAVQVLELLQQNTRLTELTKQLTERIETLTTELHQHFMQGNKNL